MALNKHDVREDFGDASVVTNASALVALATFSVVGDVNEWINAYNVRQATAVLTFTPSLAPNAGDSIKLYASKKLVDGVNSEKFPTLTNKKQLLAEFVVDSVDTLVQTLTAEIQLDNCKSGQGYLFAIESLLTTALINVNAGWVLTIIPKA